MYERDKVEHNIELIVRFLFLKVFKFRDRILHIFYNHKILNM